MQEKNVTEWQIMFTMTSGKEDFYTEDESEYNEMFQDLIDNNELDTVEQCIRKDYVWDEEIEDWKEDWVEILYDSESYNDYVDTERVSVKDEYKYKATSYFDLKYAGVEDVFYANDWSEIEDFAHEHLMKGSAVEILNTITGKEIKLNPEKYNEEFDGEFTVGPEVLEESIDTVEDDIVTYKPVIKTYNETDYGWHNNATTIYGELLDGNWYSYVPDNESIEIYNAPITNKYIDAAYNYQTDDERADDEWFDKFQQEHNITNQYTQKEIFKNSI